MGEKETPFVTAFLLMLKLFNYPVPNHLGDMFTICQRLSNALYMASYSLDMIMDHNPRSYSSGGSDSSNTYDFIIVGGGTAGSYLASRLVDMKNKYKVLVLEAGAEPSWLTHSNFFTVFNWNSNATSFRYYSMPQSNASISSRKKKVKYIQGKMLGGTMNLGPSIYSRGNPADYDAWAEATGDETWRYERLIKYFKKTENYRGKFDDSSTHGFSGTLKINSQGVQPMVKEWTDVAAYLKKNITDPNDFQTQTFGPVEVFAHEGRRQNSYDSILKKEIWRRNLKITRYATVQKVVFDSRYYAKGVIYRRNHQEIEVRANKEVILCAGVFNTPKILMLSGLGPSQHLREIGVKIKKTLEHVGKNFQDQPSSFYGPLTVLHDRTFLPRRNLTYSTILEYYVNQSGILAWNMASGVGHIATPSSIANGSTYPNIKLTLIPVGIDSDTHKVITTAFDLKHGYMESYLRDHKDNDAIWVSVSLAKPESRGQVRLRSSDPHDQPLIDPNYFALREDLQNMVEGMHFAQKMFETNIWYNVDARLISTQFPGCEKYKLKTPQYYECVATHFTVSSGNLGGTCRMGKTKDDSVVNSKLLVHKVKRLRIVDASIMPVVPNGGTGTAVYMLAERAAEIINDHWVHEVARHRDKSDSGSDEQ